MGNNNIDGYDNIDRHNDRLLRGDDLDYLANESSTRGSDDRFGDNRGFDDRDGRGDNSRGGGGRNFPHHVSTASGGTQDTMSLETPLDAISDPSRKQASSETASVGGAVNPQYVAGGGPEHPEGEEPIPEEGQSSSPEAGLVVPRIGSSGDVKDESAKKLTSLALTTTTTPTSSSQASVTLNHHY